MIEEEERGRKRKEEERGRKIPAINAQKYKKIEQRKERKSAVEANEVQTNHDSNFA